MEVFNIEKIKNKLKSGLSESESFKYFMVVTVFISIIMMPILTPDMVLNIYQILSDVLIVVFTIFGTWYVYHKNKGAKGKNFFQRYFALNLVLSVRFLLIGLLLVCMLFAVSFLSGMILGSTYPEILEDGDGVMTIYSVAWLTVFQIVYYWRLGVHMSDLAEGVIEK